MQMTNIQDIFQKYDLNSSLIEELKKEARIVAIDCGKGTDTKQLQPKSWDLIDDLSHSVWDSDKSNLEKIDLGFQLYDYFPSYFHCLVPFYQLIRHNELESQDSKNIIWQRFMYYLGSEPYYADPVAYVLWVEFFEDESTANETWVGLMNHSTNRKSLLKLLEYSGPIPFELKEPLYYKLLPDQDSHQAIFMSLFFSAHDIYGQIDNKKAKKILSKLNINTDNEDYRSLIEKIGIHSG